MTGAALRSVRAARRGSAAAVLLAAAGLWASPARAAAPAAVG